MRSIQPSSPSQALQRSLMSGAVTSEALTQAYLERIARFDHHGPEYRSVLGLNPDAPWRPPARSTGNARLNKLRGPLHGIPIIVKDNIETRERGGDDGRTGFSALLPAAGRRAPRGASAHGGRHSFGQGQFERVGQFPFDPLLQRLERYRRPDPQRLRPRPQPLRLERRLCRGRSRELLRRGHRDRDQRVDSRRPR